MSDDEVAISEINDIAFLGRSYAVAINLVRDLEDSFRKIQTALYVSNMCQLHRNVLMNLLGELYNEMCDYRDEYRERINELSNQH